MIQLTAPNNYQYRHKATKQIIGKTVYFCDWADYEKFELAGCNKFLQKSLLKGVENGNFRNIKIM